MKVVPPSAESAEAKREQDSKEDAREKERAERTSKLHLFSPIITFYNLNLLPLAQVRLTILPEFTSWGEPERAPHRRVECLQSIIIYYGMSVTHAPL